MGLDEIHGKRYTKRQTHNLWGSSLAVVMMLANAQNTLSLEICFLGVDVDVVAVLDKIQVTRCMRR